MACGLPVITTRQCGTAEIIEDGVSGFVVDALAIGDLAQRLSQLNAPAAHDMGRRARARAEGFGMDTMVEQFLSLYRRLGVRDRL
jgi:UDP-glucose:(heptosyl)LPS alpha-1,3-glucosyltransferase